MELLGPFLWAAFRCHLCCHLDLVAVWQAVPLVTFHGPHAPSQPCPVLLKLCMPWPQPFLLAQLAMAVRGAAHGRGAEELGLHIVSLQLQNLIQTRWCTKEMENWQ